MELYVIRHGKTDWNKECRFQGSKDIPLNEEGRDSAKKLGERLANVDFNAIFSSPLSRAYETATLVRGERKIQLSKEELITEVSFGDFEGLPFDDWMNTENPRKYFFDAPEKYVPPTNGETFEHAMERAKKFLKSKVEPLYEKYPNGRIMIVAHGAILAALMSVIENRTLKNYWGNGLKKNCEETIYNYDGKKWSFENDDTDHIATLLRQGKIVILPTDTVYGFSGIVDTASSNNTYKTDEKIRRIKGREESKPLIQLIAKPEDIKLYTNDEIPPELLAKWPGALTIIIHTKENAPLAPHAKLPTIAFRCPGDPWLRKIIEKCDSPIYSTSVNHSGKPVLDTIDDIKKEFSSEVDFIVDDGDKKDALPSTLVSVENGVVKVLRQGSVII